MKKDDLSRVNRGKGDSHGCKSIENVFCDLYVVDPIRNQLPIGSRYCLYESKLLDSLQEKPTITYSLHPEI